MGVGIIIVSLMIFLPLAVLCLVAVYPEQPSLLQSLERSKLLFSTHSGGIRITFKQSKVFSHLTQAQSAVVTEGSAETTASLECQNV